jgi:hypothetical protein
VCVSKEKTLATGERWKRGAVEEASRQQMVSKKYMLTEEEVRGASGQNACGKGSEV